MSEAELSIGEVAAKAGISVSAIRYYERRGLLPRAERVGGRRRFDQGVTRRLEVIASAKRAGFSLEEVGALLASQDEGAPAHEQIRKLAARKLSALDAEIERARARRDWLVAAGACGCESLQACGLFDPALLPG